MNESEFKTLRELASAGSISQRELSKKLGLSLGGANYVVKELIKKGYIKAQRFKNSKSKMSYFYVLTPRGINARIKQTQYFLEKKLEEYEMLKTEIDELKREHDRLNGSGEGVG